MQYYARMQALVNVFALSCLVAALQVATLPLWIPVASASGPPEYAGSGQAGADRWVPSLAVTSGVTVQEWTGSVKDDFCAGCTIPGPGTVPLRVVQPSGSDVDVTAFVSGGLELMTPELHIPTSPRFFVGGEIAGAFGADRRVATEGNPNQIRSPLPEQAQDQTPFSEDGALGQGGQIQATMKSVTYNAYGGVAFPFSIYDRGARLKLSAGWIRYGVDLEGLVVDAQCLPVGGGLTRCNTTPQDGPGFLREVRLKSRGSKDFDGVGPGIDLEVDVGRFGPVGSSLFIGARFYRILGDRSISLRDQVTITDQLGTGDNADARFDFEVDKWMYRVGLGLRVHWLGFSD